MAILVYQRVKKSTKKKASTFFQGANPLHPYNPKKTGEKGAAPNTVDAEFLPGEATLRSSAGE